VVIVKGLSFFWKYIIILIFWRIISLQLSPNIRAYTGGGFLYYFGYKIGKALKLFRY
jgi:hypothetical protein